MNKSYILTALGVVGSSLLTINANADTIYMCKTCKAGTYANNNKCETCPAGSYCIDGVKKSCPAGKFSASGASSCSACPDGEYQNESGRHFCKPCFSTPYDFSELKYKLKYFYEPSGNDMCISPSVKEYSGNIYFGTGSDHYFFKEIGERSKPVLFYDSHMCGIVEMSIPDVGINISVKGKYNIRNIYIESISCNKVTGKGIYIIGGYDNNNTETFEY